MRILSRLLLLPNWQSGGHDRPIPRTQTFEFAIEATNGRNRYYAKEIRLIPRESIAEVPFPINLPSPDMDTLKESMRQILQMIMDFFEEEMKQVDRAY